RRLADARSLHCLDWDIQDAASSGSVLYEREQAGGWKRVASNRLFFLWRATKERVMPLRSPRVLTAIALFVVAPIGAAVIISVLLLFGVTPHLVFLPGFAVRNALGFHTPNA